MRNLALVVCIALTGCSSGGSTGGNGNLTFTEFCTKYVEAFGTQAAGCLGGPKDIWITAVTQGAVVNCADQAKAVTAMRATYDPASAQACLTEIAAISCVAATSGSAVLAECKKTLNGTVATGATCYGDIDCGQGNYCAKPANTCTGSCKVQIAAGAMCAAGDECVSGYYCSMGTCTINPPSGTAEVGASCTGSVRCKLGLTCNDTTKNCVTPAKEGQACVFGQQTCELFTACSQASNTCVRYPGPGGNCGTPTVTMDGGTISSEYIGCLNSYCKIPSGSFTGTCTLLLAENATCSNGGECASSTCTATKCAAVCVVP